MARLSGLPPSGKPVQTESPPLSDTNHGDDGIAKLLARGKHVEVAELDISGNVRQTWLHQTGNVLVPVKAGKQFSTGPFSLAELKKAVFDSFLPVGFPHSVSTDYLAYQTYDSLQAFFSTITALLANRALLQGLGVGDASSSATFAMLLTILKDAMSRIATIGFAHRFGLRIEPDAKRYRFMADLFNDTAFFLELYSPYLGSWGKILALTTGEALRALCGVAAGASKAALSMHFARHDNLAELNAKEASQETAVGLVGLVVGTVVVKWIEEPRSVVYLMVVLVFAHLWMNYLGVRSVCMDTLNRQRATILFKEYLRSGKVLSPAEVALRENIIFWDPIIQNRHSQDVVRLSFAQSYPQAMQAQMRRHKFSILDGLLHTKFISPHVPGVLTQINMLLSEGAGPKDAILAWFKAMEIAWHMDKDSGYTDSVKDIFSDDGKQGSASRELRCSESELWQGMEQKGWYLGAQSLEMGAPLRLRVRAEHPKKE